MIDFDFQQISREIKIWKGKLSEPQIYAKCLRLLPDLSINDFKEIYESTPTPPPEKEGGRTGIVILLPSALTGMRLQYRNYFRFSARCDSRKAQRALRITDTFLRCFKFMQFD